MMLDSKYRCWTLKSVAVRTSPMPTSSPSSSSAASSCSTSLWLSSWTTSTTSPGLPSKPGVTWPFQGLLHPGRSPPRRVHQDLGWVWLHTHTHIHTAMSTMAMHNDIYSKYTFKEKPKQTMFQMTWPCVETLQVWPKRHGSYPLRWNVSCQTGATGIVCLKWKSHVKNEYDIVEDHLDNDWSTLMETLLKPWRS